MVSTLVFIVLALIALVVAFKVLKGIVKFAVLGALVLLALLFFTGHLPSLPHP